MREVEEQESVAPKKKKKKLVRANREDYFRLYYEVLGDLKRDLLSGSLMTKTTGKWEPAINYLNVLGSEAADYADSKGIDYSQQLIEKHFSALEFVTEPELLINIPVWDGVDRIEEISSVIKCSNLSPTHVYELLKQFGATIFQRIYGHNVQPITPILQGKQGLGKDTLINALCGGFGDYFRDLNVSGYDMTEALRQLHTGIVFNIPEFDKTARKEAAGLKHLLTAPFTDIRLPWGKTATKRDVRCSFIASSNPEGVLTDPTGNRRFWVFNMTYAGYKEKGVIEQTYPGHYARKNHQEERMQILAQFKSLIGYRASDESIEAQTITVETLTPDNIEELSLHEFDVRLDKVDAIPRRIIDGIKYYDYEQIKGILGDICKEFEIRRKLMLSTLKRSRRYKRMKEDRLYCSMTGHQLVAVIDEVIDIL